MTVGSSLVLSGENRRAVVIPPHTLPVNRSGAVIGFSVLASHDTVKRDRAAIGRRAVNLPVAFRGSPYVSQFNFCPNRK